MENSFPHNLCDQSGSQAQPRVLEDSSHILSHLSIPQLTTVSAHVYSRTRFRARTPRFVVFLLNQPYWLIMCSILNWPWLNQNLLWAHKGGGWEKRTYLAWICVCVVWQLLTPRSTPGEISWGVEFQDVRQSGCVLHLLPGFAASWFFCILTHSLVPSDLYGIHVLAQKLGLR